MNTGLGKGTGAIVPIALYGSATERIASTSVHWRSSIHMRSLQYPTLTYSVWRASCLSPDIASGLLRHWRPPGSVSSYFC